MITSVALHIREAAAADLDSIIGLLAQLSPPRPGETAGGNTLGRTLAAMEENPDYCLCLAEREGRTLGTATLLVQRNLSHGGRPYGHIENVVTDAACRGNGVGRGMVEFLSGRARERGCYKIILNCEAHNIPFYQRCGFRVTGELEMRLDP